MNWPAWSLLGGATYTPSHDTDIRERFRRIRLEQDRERRDRERVHDKARESVSELFSRALNGELPKP